MLASVHARAQPVAPATIVVAPSNAHGELVLAWSAAPGATGYRVKRGPSPEADLATIAPVLPAGTLGYTDTAAAGTRHYYTVTALDGTGESPPTRGVYASPAVLVDNAPAGSSAPGVVFTGTWATSSVAGFFGAGAVFAPAVSGSSPTASYTFTPSLPASGNYDVYLRWTAHANRASNTPVDLVFPDGQTSVTVNQQLDGGTWNYIGTVTAEPGTSASIVIRNNGANGNVVADAVQFVPRHAPRAPVADAPQDYTLISIDEPFDGTSLNPSLWGVFAGRSAVTVANGRLNTQQLYVGSVPLASATTADLENEANWNQGGIIADHARKFGYHEARLRLPRLPARGVDTAYWHAATDELIHGYELDAPEFFNKDSSGAQNDFAFGNWDHVLPTVQRINPDTGKPLALGRTWDYHRKSIATFGDLADYITVGFEWRTDNTQVVYLNGEKVYTAPASGMNDIESILPAQIILSTKVLDWMRPNAELHGAEANWDYVRYYQKPGFLGAIDGDWTRPGNWGPDGLPSPGYTAVFNLSNAPADVSVPTDQSLHTLYLEGGSLPAHVFTGPGKLLLGAGKPGDTSVTHGGILVNTNVTAHQTFHNEIVGLQNLQIANLSRTPGVALTLHGTISGDGAAPRDLDFLSPIAATPGLGTIVLARPLGPGLRHINRSGDGLFTLPEGNQHDGNLRIYRGPVAIPALSSLGVTADSAVEFLPRYKHSDPWRPRLIYTGPAAVSDHPILLGHWQADGVLESSGTGPLAWNGDLAVAPSSPVATQSLTRSPRFTLGGGFTGADNVFSGAISDAGVIVTYLNEDGSPNTGPAALQLVKAGPTTWVLSGPVSLSAPLNVNAGKLFLGQGSASPVSVPSVTVASGAEFGFGADTDVMFSSPIGGAGSFRKRGAGTLTLAGDHTYAGTTAIDAGSILFAGSLAGTGTVTAAAGTTIAGNALIAGGLSVSGVFSPGSFTLAGSLNLRASSVLRVAFVANNGPASGFVSAPVLGITSGARVDVVLDAPGSSTRFRQTFWRTARSFPLIACSSRSGALALGTVTADSAGEDASAFGSFSLEHKTNGVYLLWTPLPGFPDVDVPSIALASPASGPVVLLDTSRTLRLATTVGGGASTVIAWSQLSGPGLASFSSASAADSFVTFSSPGTYLLRATATNALGSVSTDLTVVVAPPRSLILRQGVDNYAHAATFLRGDNVTWNSGARDQLLVGRTSAVFRGLLGFDLAAVPAHATVSSATLDVWTDFAGSGTVADLELRPLLRSFVEGTGNGTVATNGPGSGADWNTHDGAVPWTTPGGEFGATVLSSVAGFAASEINTQKTFAPGPAFVAAAQAAASSGTPLSLAIVSPLTESGANNNFIRFASDDHANSARRPRLTLGLDYSFAPAPDPGIAPAAIVNQPAALAGAAAYATASLWSLVDGPGTAAFVDPASPATSVTFSAAGTYVLRLAAFSGLGEVSRTLSVTAAARPLSPLEAWRVTHFGLPTNAGDAHDLADPDADGLPNLLEFATGSLPTSAASFFPPVASVDSQAGTLRLDFYRSVAALSSVTTIPEWTDSLASPTLLWSDSGLSTQILSDNGSVQQIRASVPLPATGTRFLRLRVTSP